MSTSARSEMSKRRRICNTRANSDLTGRERLLPLLLLLLLVGLVHGVVATANSNNRDNNRRSMEAKSSNYEEAAPIDAYSDPHFAPNRQAIVQLFEWKFADVAKECSDFLGPMGYAGVQISPVTEHLIVRTASVQRPWWERYWTVSYELATRSGNADDFLAMSRACNAAGVRLYVDVVLNYMAGPVDGASDTPPQSTGDSSWNSTLMEYPAVPYTAKDFHRPCSLENRLDAHELRDCQVDGRPDLDHGRGVVQRRIVQLLDRLVEMGVAGFRVDGAKYMWPVHLKNIFAAVRNLNSADFDFPAQARPFVSMDVFDLGADAVSKTEYTSYGVVSEYLYAAELAIVFGERTSPLSSLINWGPAMGFLPHRDALVFVDSVQGQRGRLATRSITYKKRRQLLMATAFMLAHPYGRIKRIMSSYRLASADADSDVFDRGPPAEDEAIASPAFDESEQCTRDGGWVCEHRWPGITNLLAMVNALGEEHNSVTNFQTDGPNHIAFCRGRSAFVAINNDAEREYATEVHTCLEEGVYCDVIGGGPNEEGTACRGKRIEVNAEGNADIVVPVVEEEEGEKEPDVAGEVDDFGVIAIYVGSKVVEGVEAIAGQAEAASETEAPVEVAKEEVEVEATDSVKLPDAVEIVEVVEPGNVEPESVEPESVEPESVEPVEGVEAAKEAEASASVETGAAGEASDLAAAETVNEAVPQDGEAELGATEPPIAASSSDGDPNSSDG